jgi:hypothetical protein
MSIEAMKQALEVLETLARYENPETRIQVRKPKDGGPIVTMYPHKVASDAVAALRAAIEQAEKPKYRRGTYVRCMESDELCRVWTTSIDGGAWVKWPDGSITTYTAEQMGQAFSLEQTAPGKPAGYLSKGELFYPLEIINRGVGDAVPLYEHPRQWVGLTDEDKAALDEQYGNDTLAHLDAIEAKLKEKNT